MGQENNVTTSNQNTHFPPLSWCYVMLLERDTIVTLPLRISKADKTPSLPIQKVKTVLVLSRYSRSSLYHHSRAGLMTLLDHNYRPTSPNMLVDKDALKCL